MARRRARTVTQPEPEQDEEEPQVEGVFLVRKGLGHALIRVEMPYSLLVKHAVSIEAPEVRPIVAARLIEWAERVP